MPRSRSLFPAIFLILAASVAASPQGRSGLRDRIEASVRKANPRWHFIPGVCTCPALVRDQSSYALGSWYLGKLASSRRVSIYISYVPTPASAADWMAALRNRSVETGRHREQYQLADDAYLWTSNTGYAYLYLRNGSIVIEVSGALDDVKFFARCAKQQMTPDNKSLDRAQGASFSTLIDRC